MEVQSLSLQTPGHAYRGPLKSGKRNIIYTEKDRVEPRRNHPCIANVPFECGWNGVLIHHLCKDKDGNSYSPHHQRFNGERISFE